MLFAAGAFLHLRILTGSAERRPRHFQNGKPGFEVDRSQQFIEWRNIGIFRHFSLLFLSWAEMLTAYRQRFLITTKNEANDETECNEGFSKKNRFVELHRDWLSGLRDGRANADDRVERCVSEDPDRIG